MDTNLPAIRPSKPPTLGVHVTRRLLSITRQDWRQHGDARWGAALRDISDLSDLSDISDLSDLTLPALKTKVAASLTADAGEIGA
jgi:hypothetical protein